MSFLSPSQKSTGAKIAFFEQLPSTRRRKGKPGSKRGSNMSSPTQYQKLPHHRGDGNAAVAPALAKKIGSRGNSPRSTRSPLGIMLSPGFWPHGSYESVASHSSSASSSTMMSSPIPTLPMVTPDRFDQPNNNAINRNAAVAAPTPLPRSPQSSSATGNEEDLVTMLQRHILDLVPDRNAADRAGRDENFQLLQSKLHMIRHGLHDIERERKELVDKCQRLETEKVKVRKQLENREREIVKLSQRCAEQTAQVKEATLIRREHRDLNSQVQGLKYELSMSDVKDCQVFKDLKKQLLECQAERDRLKNRLEKLQIDYDNVSDSLQECMQKITVLNGKQQQWQDSQAMHERATNQQRLQHTVVVQRLQRSLSSRDDEIQRLTQVFKSAQATHERQMEEAEARDRAIIGELKEENRRLAANNEHLQQSTKQDVEDKVGRLQADIAQRDELIAKLVSEVEVNMKHLMSSNASLQQAEEDSRMFQSLTADIEALQQEQESLQDQLHERDTTIAELSAQVIRMEMERTFGAGFDESETPPKCGSTEHSNEKRDEDLHNAGATIQNLQDQLDSLRKENLQLSQALESEREASRTTTEAPNNEPESEVGNELVGSELLVLERQIVELVAEKRKMETALALRNDEIRELRIIEVPELEDQLAEAQRKLATTEADLRCCREELSMCGGSVEPLQIVNDLTTEVEKQRELSRLHQRQLKEAHAENSILSKQLVGKEEARQVLQAELVALKSEMESLRAMNDDTARFSTKDEFLGTENPASQGVNEGEEVEVSLLGQQAARLESVRGEDSLSTYEQFVKRRHLGRPLKETVQRINRDERLSIHHGVDQRTNNLRDLELKHASLNEKMKRHQSSFQHELRGRAVLRERSNSFRCISPEERRVENQERKGHRSSASEPAFDLP